MKILLTNDDGYNSLGIKLLKEKLQKYGEVFIVAPSSAMSGASVSIIYGKPVKVVEVEDKVYKMEGTPADCVAYGLSSLGIDFDLVVSGVNNGLNISFDTLFSGTVGACLNALTYKVAAIAFSSEINHLDIVEKYFDSVLDFVIKEKLLDNEHVINVNFPVSNTSKGIKITHLHYRDKKENTYYQKVDKDTYVAKRKIEDHLNLDPDSDAYAIHHGYISITVLNKTF